MTQIHHYDLLGARRRQFLAQGAMGIGALAWAGLTAGAEADQLPAKARRVIWLYMDGGMSHIDTFDPKPELNRRHGEPFPMKIEATQFDTNGPILGSPWKFARHGQSGLWMSELFPHMAKHADKLAIMRSMTNESAVHAIANYWMHTGWGQIGRPSLGSWLNYGLGSEADNLPGYVVLNSGLIPTGGMDNLKPGFLPAKFSPSVFRSGDVPLSNVLPAAADRQARRLAAIQAQDNLFLKVTAEADAVEGAIKAYELAARLQTSVPEIINLDTETKATQSAYGLDAEYEHTRTYGRQCLLARRLVEQGVRFVALTLPRVHADARWDAHGNLKGNHNDHARCVDQPIGALLEDLESRGLLDSTLIVLTTEFGRTPFTQGSDGRDHNEFAFTAWLAGGGVKGGTVYGETDEFGYKVVNGKILVHDFHATILHLMGIDHTKLTYHFAGRNYRLTDVHGRVVKEVLA